jgi:hypothetical protein
VLVVEEREEGGQEIGPCEVEGQGENQAGREGEGQVEACTSRETRGARVGLITKPN